MKTTKWNIYEELKTAEDIQAFVEASIIEAENDTDPSLLAHALGIAAKARIRARIERAGKGNFGNWSAEGSEVRAMVIDYGPGYRLYYTI